MEVAADRDPLRNREETPHRAAAARHRHVERPVRLGLRPHVMKDLVAAPELDHLIALHGKEMRDENASRLVHLRRLRGGSEDPIPEPRDHAHEYVAKSAVGVDDDLLAEVPVSRPGTGWLAGHVHRLALGRCAAEGDTTSDRGRADRLAGRDGAGWWWGWLAEAAATAPDHGGENQCGTDRLQDRRHAATADRFSNRCHGSGSTLCERLVRVNKAPGRTA